MPAPEVVILGKDGTEHVFPAGFDPKKAAEIVWRQEGGSLAKLAQLNDTINRIPSDLSAGIAKGAGRTAVGLGSLMHRVPGVSNAVDALYALAGQQVNSGQMMADPAAARAGLGIEPSNATQRVGATAEQIAEFFIPGAMAEKTATAIAAKVAPRVPTALQAVARFAPRMATEGAAASAVTAAQGGDPVTGAAAGAAGPVVGAVAGRTVKAIGNTARPLVRAALKPTVTEMKRQAGASITGIDAQANQLADFIIKNRLTTPDKAEAIIVDAEKELQRLVTGSKAVTDAPQRAQRYLEAVKRSAAKQGLGAADVSAIVKKQRELLKSSPLSEDVVSVVQRPSPSGLVNASGQPVMVPTNVTTRALRTDVTPAEALDVARSTSRWSTRKQYGELKGASVEADKAVERAARDSVKASVPGAEKQLQTQARAITAKKVLQRQAFREANRDAVSLPAHVIAAGEIAQGKVPVMAAAANWLRNNQLKAGIWADRLSTALKRNDVQEVSRIMNRISVAGTAQASR